MANPWKMRLGGVNLSAGDAGDSEEVPEELPFRMLVCGDFSGKRANPPALESRKPVFVDRDNFEELQARMAPQVTVPWEGDQNLTITFKEIEDFEPDRLLNRLGVFEDLRTLLEDVGKPSSFDKAA